MLKTAPLGNTEALAGHLRHALLYVVDEASAVSDAALAVIGGSLTNGPWNRMLQMQPWRGVPMEKKNSVPVID